MSSAIGASTVEILNQRLSAELGRRGSVARFAWKWAPAQSWYVYDTDDRTILKKTWADAPAPGGGTIGRCWVLAEWRPTKASDHCGYGEGVRVAVANKVDYFPYFETTLAEGRPPTEDLNANYIWALRHQLDMSAELREDSMSQWMAEEKYTSDRNSEMQRTANRERAMHVYDDNVGGFGNCIPGTAGGFLSWGGTDAES